MQEECELLLTYNERNEVITVPSSTSVPDLLKKATETFNIHVHESEGLTLECFHERVKKWVRVEDDFKLLTGTRLRVTLIDESGRDIQVNI